jgi:CDP-paratose 2-epimerase
MNRNNGHSASNGHAASERGFAARGSRTKLAANGLPPGAIGIQAERRPVLITGGAGFIGTNVAHRYLTAGQPVIIYDNLSRPGVERNLAWLKERHGKLVQAVIADVRDAQSLTVAVGKASRVFHFAAQVAVTSSLDDPCFDFEVNARGTLTLLEALRTSGNRAPLIFTSTNKVYGDMADVRFRKVESRYEPRDREIQKNGFSEQRCLDFHSPYGCSKGAADQYVLDYARTFKLPAVVFRMSCIYGWHQFGNEDQGWVAHFLIRALQNEPITIYGDGRQVRDVLFIEDLVNAFLHAQNNIDSLQGEVFNIGGGPANTTSLLELMELIRRLRGKAPEIQFDDWRPADQLYYVADIRKFSSATGWSPRVSVAEGIEKLCSWLESPEFAAGALELAAASVSGNGHGRAANNGNGHRSRGDLDGLQSMPSRTIRRPAFKRLKSAA